MFSHHSLPGKRRSAFLGQYVSDIGLDTLSIDGVHRHLHRLWVRVKDRQFQKSQRNQHQAQKRNQQPSAGLTLPLSDGSPHGSRAFNPLFTSAAFKQWCTFPHVVDLFTPQSLCGIMSLSCIRPHHLIHIAGYIVSCQAQREKRPGMANPSFEGLHWDVNTGQLHFP